MIENDSVLVAGKLFVFFCCLVRNGINLLPRFGIFFRFDLKFFEEYQITRYNTRSGKPENGDHGAVFPDLPENNN